MYGEGGAKRQIAGVVFGGLPKNLTRLRS